MGQRLASHSCGRLRRRNGLCHVLHPAVRAAANVGDVGRAEGDAARRVEARASRGRGLAT
jgi:hypothetical protein